MNGVQHPHLAARLGRRLCETVKRPGAGIPLGVMAGYNLWSDHRALAWLAVAGVVLTLAAAAIADEPEELFGRWATGPRRPSARLLRWGSIATLLGLLLAAVAWGAWIAIGAPGLLWLLLTPLLFVALLLLVGPRDAARRAANAAA